MFLPHQPLLNWFKIAMFIITMITLIYVPLKGSFDLKVESGSAQYFFVFIIPFVLYTFEMFITLNTAYYEEGDI